jgi:hypothetical protein
MLLITGRDHPQLFNSPAASGALVWATLERLAS